VTGADSEVPTSRSQYEELFGGKYTQVPVRSPSVFYSFERSLLPLAKSAGDATDSPMFSPTLLRLVGRRSSRHLNGYWHSLVTVTKSVPEERTFGSLRLSFLVATTPESNYHQANVHRLGGLDTNKQTVVYSTVTPRTSGLSEPRFKVSHLSPTIICPYQY